MTDSKPKVKDVMPEHIDHVAKNMRQHDVDELYRHALLAPLQGLNVSVQNSQYKKAIVLDGKCIGIFGVGTLSMMSTSGFPWILCTPELEKHAMRYLRGSKKYVKEMLAQFDVLENYVYEDNHFTIKWLKWLGFDILEKETYGPLNLQFHKFRLEAQK